MLRDKIENAQRGCPQDMLELVRKFMPLLKKYAHKLAIEDALNELMLQFIELIHSMQLEGFRSTEDGVLVRYIARAVKNTYIALLKHLLLEKGTSIAWDELTEAQEYELVCSTAEQLELQQFEDLLCESTWRVTSSL